VTHKDPDVDGIGSMLAFGKALLNAGKEVVFLTEEKVPSPISHLKGADGIIWRLDPGKNFDVVLAFDCGDRKRLGVSSNCLEGRRPLINIDHHETNDFFGDLNLVDADSSSTGELVFELIKGAGFPVDSDIAENLFAAIQNDTGSFRYENTTPRSLEIAAELLRYGVSPSQVSQKITGGYGLSRLKLLQMALDAMEFYYDGRIGIMTVSSEMFKNAGASWEESEKFVDYPRYVSGVEVAALIRQTGKNNYKLSLRSNDNVNVSLLASCFGGGGHARAAGFKSPGPISNLKKNFLKKAGRFLDGTSH